MNIIFQFLIIGSFVLLFSCDNASPKTTWSIEQKVQGLIQKMSVEEKVGQMTQVNITVVAKHNDVTNLSEGEHALDPKKLKHAIVDCHVGSILNALEGRKNIEGWHEVITDIQKMALKQTPNKIPVLFGVDAIHGATYIFGSTLFPHNIGIAASRNTQHAYNAAVVTAKETRASGVPWNFDPVFDIGRTPLWPRFPETYGEDVALATDFGVASVKGYEDRGVGDLTGVASCMKHYVGYSKPTSGWDRTPASIPERELREYYLPQFQAAIKAGAKTLMINSGEVNGIPTHANKYMLTDVLRDEMGFTGLAVSDWQDIIYLYTKHKVASSPKEAVKIAVMAGVDMSMVPMDLSFYDLLLELVQEGEVPMSRIDEAVTRILTIKYELGLFDNPYPDPKALENFKRPEYKALALAGAEESMTLLKNEKELLPISANSKILLVGPGANNKSSLHGCWSYSWQGNEEEKYPETTLTIKDAFENALGAENVICQSVSDYDSPLNYIVSKVENVDYVVLCIGENAYAETPGSIKDLNLDARQKSLVRKAKSWGKPLIVILTEGRPRVLNDIEPLMDAVLMAYWPSEMGAQAIVNTIIGKNNPSGKLPFTYPRHTGHHVLYDCKYIELGLEETQGGFKYSGYTPQWGFGYGLSYTSFEYSNMSIDKDTVTVSDTLLIRVDVKNTGLRTGKIAVELYSRDLVASITPSYRRLRKYLKVELSPAETQTVAFKLSPQELQFIGIDNRWTLEEGGFELLIGDLVQAFYLKE